MNELSESQIGGLVAWSIIGTIVYMMTFQHVNSRIKLPIWAIICGPVTTGGTIIYWFFWSIYFMFFKR